MDRQQLSRLLAKYRNGELTEEERSSLARLLDTREGQKLIYDEWDRSFDPVKTQEAGFDTEKLFGRIAGDDRVKKQWREEPTNRPGTTRKISSAAIAIAASVLVVLTIGGYFFLQHGNNTPGELLAWHQEIVPGSDRAIILLDDGTAIELDKITQDTILQDGQLRILRRADGGISYDVDGDVATTQPVYNTIITPRGGEYRVVLSDGTTVWVNAESKLRYPVVFASDTREVEVEGEAYFEVQKSTKNGKKRPFIVKTGDQTLEVLGTRFNINNYDGNITTTLVEGAVALRYDGRQDIHYLNPSQQAEYSIEQKKVSIEKVDTYYTLAWKNGKFAFDNASIERVMQEVSRWYDIDVVYQGDMSSVRYTGTISRFENFKQLLQLIEWTGSVKFQVDGRRVTVM
ncbi:FecR protein [Parapedobacter composti]|uniref:FecR protein n=1 Tax=Parapedobacter composti TaxID=623281 RepID=A0A1I1LL90_9SPHI|nr:FecR family protein [Parapedobacter composti]SFC73894.1 FecR protein [Parapedobacter composti]